MPKLGKLLGLLSAICIGSIPALAEVYDMDQIFAEKAALAKQSTASRQAIIEKVISSTKRGDVVQLSRKYAVGDVNFSQIANGVTIKYGSQGRAFFDANRTYRDLTFYFAEIELHGLSKKALEAGATGSKARFENTEMFFSGGLNNAHEDGSKRVGFWIRDGGSWDKSDADWTNSVILYMNYNCNSGNQVGTRLNWTNINATNSMIYGLVETNYTQLEPSMIFKNVKGLTMGTGDTESHAAKNGLYRFENCDNITIVNHRNFNAHRNPNTNGYYFAGGKNNTLYGIVDIGGSTEWSLSAETEENFRIFGAFLQNIAKGPSGEQKLYQDFQVLNYTPFGWGSKSQQSWSNPAFVGLEKIIAAGGKEVGFNTEWDNAPDFSGTQLSEPPRVPTVDLQDFMKNDPNLFFNVTLKSLKTSSAWGQAVIDAGADITGKTSSSAAIQKVVNQQDFVELPKGVLLLDKTVHIRPGQKVFGAGKDLTIIRKTGDFSPFSTEKVPHGLAKTSDDLPPVEGVITGGNWGNFTLDGQNTNKFGIHVPNCVWQSDHVHNVKFINFTVAGAAIGTPGIWHKSSKQQTDIKTESRPQFQGGCANDGYDQVRFTFCDFENTGDYGIFTNNGQFDKGLYLKNTFKDQNIAGISSLHSHMMEATSIVENTFENINGPGVFFGLNSWAVGVPTGIGPIMLMQNTFIECGNEDYAPIEWGYVKQGLVVENKVVLKTKEVPYIFRGTGTAIQGFDLTEVDASKVKKAAIALRHPHRIDNNRLTGNFVVDVNSENPIILLEDRDYFSQLLGDDFSKGNPDQMNYDYAYSSFIINSQFGGQQLDYVLATQNFAGDEVIAKELRTNQSIELSSEIGAVTIGQQPAKIMQGQESWKIHDPMGRFVGEITSLDEISSKLNSLGSKTGLYFISNPRGNVHKHSYVSP